MEKTSALKGYTTEDEQSSVYAALGLWQFKCILGHSEQFTDAVWKPEGISDHKDQFHHSEQTASDPQVWQMLSGK